MYAENMKNLQRPLLIFLFLGALLPLQGCSSWMHWEGDQPERHAHSLKVTTAAELNRSSEHSSKASDDPQADSGLADIRQPEDSGRTKTGIDIGQSYRIEPQDRIRIVVYNEADLSAEHVVDDDGTVPLPLIGRIQLSGLTLRQATKHIESKYRGDYLTSPVVSVDILNRSPVYVFGEVNRPGSYSFKDGMTLFNAIALSGGFTYRANAGSIEIKRDDRILTVRGDLSRDTAVQPGDIIRVDERFF